MNKKYLPAFTLFLISGWYQGNAMADGDAAPSAVASPLQGGAAPSPNDEYDWKGDVVQLRSDVEDIKGSKGSGTYFAPEGYVFDVVGDDRTTNRLTVKFRPPPVSKKESSISIFLKSKSTEDRNDLPAGTMVGLHSTYILDKAAVENIPHRRYGWTFGALIVPFKYQLFDKSFSGSTTIGPYLGYRIQGNRGSTTPVISAGWVNNIPVALANGTGTIDRSGFSIAGGVVFSVDKGTGIQVGVLVGQDRLGSNAVAPYRYEGKTWFSLSIGFKLI